MTRPSLQLPSPGPLWPPPRTARSISWWRAKFTAVMTSATSATRAISRGRLSIHRRLGRVGAGLVMVMVVTGLSTAVRGARDGWNPGGPYPDALSFMFVGIADMAVFSVLTTGGLVWRNRPDVHMRLMVLGTSGGLMWPAITRMPLVAGRFPLMFGLLTVLVLAPAVHDFLTRSRARWLSLGIGLSVLATFPLRVAIGNSVAWRTFAAWIIEPQ